MELTLEESDISADKERASWYVPNPSDIALLDRKHSHHGNASSLHALDVFSPERTFR